MEQKNSSIDMIASEWVEGEGDAWEKINKNV